MKHNKSFLTLLSFIFCAQVADGFVPDGANHMVIKIRKFSHPIELSESITGSLYAAQAMNDNGVPKDIINFMLRINWLLRQEECNEWCQYIDAVNDCIRKRRLRGSVSVFDVMSLVKREKENFQLICYELIFRNGDPGIALDKKMIKAMPLYLKSKFKKDKDEQKGYCICM